jgi:hypothetical protein
MSDAPINPTRNGRHPDGRFNYGHKFARGNPVHRRMAALRGALLDATTPEDVKAVGAKLAELAKGGDVQAAKVWLDAVIGRPVQAVALTDADGEPLAGLDWGRVQAGILEALGPFSEARVAVALKLRELTDDARGDAG